MYLTHSFVAISKGDLDYLIFYITEDYVEQQVYLTKQLNPLLEELGRNLMDKGAVIKPFIKDISTVNKEIHDKFNQDYTRDVIISLEDKMERPGLLILNADLKSFDPREHDWLYLSLQGFITDGGALKIFNIKEFFDFLTSSIETGKNLFDEAKSYINKRKAISTHKMIELKPGMFGFSFDLKEAFNFFKELRKH